MCMFVWFCCCFFVWLVWVLFVLSGESFPEVCQILECFLLSLLFHCLPLSSPLTFLVPLTATCTGKPAALCHTSSHPVPPHRRHFHLVLPSAIQKAQIPHVPVLAKHHHKYLGYLPVYHTYHSK